MMKASLNHVGIAVANAGGLQRLKKLFALLGLSIDSTEPVPEQGVVTHFLPLPREQAALELLEAIDPDGVVARFVQKKGPGVHHLSFSVPQGELDTLCGKLIAEGYRMTYPAPRMGAHQMRINFIHPASAEGILIELMEPA
jgi:methylmalonyl-CoA/ethylmalonyl-CoA epimerase